MAVCIGLVHSHRAIDQQRLSSPPLQSLNDRRCSSTSSSAESRVLSEQGQGLRTDVQMVGRADLVADLAVEVDMTRIQVAVEVPVAPSRHRDIDVTGQ